MGKYTDFPVWATDDPERKSRIENILSPLRKENGGIFTKPGRNITVGDAVAGRPDKMVLFISYGGTGADALYRLKCRLKQELTPDDYAQKIRFLAVDSDRSAGYTSRRFNAEKRFESGEFLWLDNNYARHMLACSGVDAWIDPNLKMSILTDPTKLDGSGASNIRQIGRLLMFANAGDLRSKVMSVIRGLVTGHHAQLDVYIITGISGGTGSGIVIDASYIIRDAVESAFPYPGRVKINSMIMLPPTGTSTNASVMAAGNRNGYAALKEIDHFLTINRRGEIYRQNFGPGFSVTSKEPVFDACFLFDGNLTGAALNDPRDRAIEAMCGSVIDMITDKVVTNGFMTTPPLEVIMNDTGLRAKNFVMNSPSSIAPRDANYVYCTLGYGRTIIPSNLMKAYVANDIYAFIYSYYRKYALVTDDDVETFLEDAKLDISNFNQKDQAITIDQEIRKRFLAFSPNMKCGPYFVYALLDRTLGTLMLEKTEISNRLIVMHKKEKLAQIEFMAQYIASVKQSVYGVITDVLETMKSTLEAESDSLLHPAPGLNSNEFYPIDFSVTDGGASAVLKHLDNMFSPAEKAQAAVCLANALWAKRSDWSAAFNPTNTTYSTFNGANEIRAFWEKQVGEKVTADLEDCLIRYYSKDADSRYGIVIDSYGGAEDEPKAAAALTDAATEITRRMLSTPCKAAPCLAMDKRLQSRYGTWKSAAFFLVPKGFSNLGRYLQKQAPERVLTSSSADTVSCVTFIWGLPAFAAVWTGTAEPEYERAVSAGARGLHMTGSGAGEDMVGYPNLLPESIWPQLAGYTNAREKAIADGTRKVFCDAKELGLAQRSNYNGTEFDVYDLTVLSRTLMPDRSLFEALDREKKGTSGYAAAAAALDSEAERIADRLLEDIDSWGNVKSKESFGDAFRERYQYSDLLKTVSLCLPDTVLTDAAVSGEPEIAAWCTELAADLLRTWPETAAAARGTVLVVSKMYRKIEEDRFITNAALNFIRLAALGIIRSDEEELRWVYSDSTGYEFLLLDMNYGDKFGRQLRYYYLFRKYLENAGKIDEATFGQLKEIANVHYLEKGAPRIIKAKELAALTSEIREELRPYAQNYENPLLYGRLGAAAERCGLDRDEVIFFCKKMLDATTRCMTIDVE